MTVHPALRWAMGGGSLSFRQKVGQVLGPPATFRDPSTWPGWITIVSPSVLKMLGEFKASNVEPSNMEGSGKLSLPFLTDILISCVIKHVFLFFHIFKPSV